MCTPAVPASPEEPRRISQSELRRDVSGILWEVENGAEFIITNRGRPVAQLSGLVYTRQPRLVYTPASRPLELDLEKLVRSPISSEEILDAIREERSPGSAWNP